MQNTAQGSVSASQGIVEDADHIISEARQTDYSNIRGARSAARLASVFKPDRITNYYPKIRPTLLERLFGYDRQTFRNWEADKSTGKGPVLRPVLEGQNNAQRRYYTVNDILSIYDYLEKNDEYRPALPSPVKLAVWNNKGGVGKTTIVQQLASTMSILMGLKVLVVDTDSQSDCTYMLNCNQEIKEVRENYDTQPTIRHIFGFLDIDHETGSETEYITPLNDGIITLSPTLSIIPADSDVSELDYDFSFLENLLKDDKGRDVSKIANISDRFLNDVLDTKQYDVIIFDCAPNKGALNLNILYGADTLLIPIEVEAKCLYSLRNVLKFLKKMKNFHEGFSFNKVIGVPNKYIHTHNLKRLGLEKLKEIFQGSILSSSVIPHTTELDKCADEKEPVFIRASDNIKSRSTLMAKRVSNEFFKLSHEVLGLDNNHRVLFPEVENIYDEV
ncbi:MAG: ParA family protein [Deltaproteobacteria bacterium]|nr:ParA family protein [Deltaproteobacteria bacterium]